jgi:hypothetical protein
MQTESPDDEYLAALQRVWVNARGATGNFAAEVTPERAKSSNVHAVEILCMTCEDHATNSLNFLLLPEDHLGRIPPRVRGAVAGRKHS